LGDLIRRINRPKAEGDGIGFLLEYVGRLLHYYPSFTRQFVWDELPMVEGWAYFAFAYLDDPAHKFAGVKCNGGYVKQESERLIALAKEYWSKQKT
jgi:hypothetical protein